MEFEGTVENVERDLFSVKINDNYSVSCTLSGKIRQNSVKVLQGDRVLINVTPYDPKRGRIVFRLKN